MGARVDAGKRVVVVDDRSWPFDLNCRDGSAELRLDGGPCRLQPLLWRELLTLARYAHLGSDFLTRQFVRMSLADGRLPSADRGELAAVEALARWINEPGTPDTALPPEPALLARVTLELCRALGVAPADLSALPAAEVETLWRATATLAGDEREPEDAGSTRIVVVPDPASGAPEDESPPQTGPGRPPGTALGRAATGGEAADPAPTSAAPRRRRPTTRAGRRARSRPAPAEPPGTLDRDSDGPPAARDGRRAAGEAPGGSEADSAAAAAGAPGGPAPRRRRAPGTDTVTAPRGAAGGARAGATPARAPARGPRPPSSPRRHFAGVRVLLGGAGAWPPSPPSATPAPGAAGASGERDRAAAPPAAPAVTRRRGRPIAPSPGPLDVTPPVQARLDSRPEDSDHETLFDELSERLERAAADAGILIED